MSDQFLKLFNFTPQTFEEENNPQLKDFIGDLAKRMLPEGHGYRTTIGALWRIPSNDKFGIKNYMQKTNSRWSPEAQMLFKKLIKAARIVPSFNPIYLDDPEDPPEEYPRCSTITISQECDWVDDGKKHVDGTICADETLTSNDKRIASCRQFCDHFSDKNYKIHFVDEREKYVDDNVALTDFIEALKYFLRYSIRINIYDTWFNTDKAYIDIHEFISNIGTPKNPSEVIIHRDIYGNIDDKINKDDFSGGRIKLTDSEMLGIAKKICALMNNNRTKMEGIRNVKVIFWNDLHDRFITSNLGAFHLGQGIVKLSNYRGCVPVKITNLKELYKAHDLTNPRGHRIENKFEIEKESEDWVTRNIRDPY
jgi:hypothetical protein